MSEIEQLKAQIRKAGTKGILTAHIRDDYEPAGQMMLNCLVESGEFTTWREPVNMTGGSIGEWRIWAVEHSPYK